MPALPVTAAEAARIRLKRQRLRRRILFFVYGIPLLLLAVAVYLAFGPKPPPPPKFVAVSPQRAAAATQSIDAVRQALTQPLPTAPPPSPAVPKPTSSEKPSAPAPPIVQSQASAPVQITHTATGQDQVTMRISQADLNAYLNGNPKVKGILHKQGVHAISVALAPPSDMTILAAATFRGLSGNAEVDTELQPDPKTAVHLQVKNARFGHFPPLVIRAAVQQVLKHVFGGAHSPLPLRVTSVKVIGTDLVLSGVRKSIVPVKTAVK